MPALLPFVLSLLLAITPLSLAAGNSPASSNAHTIQQQYQSVELDQLIDQNQIPERMVEKKQRVMLSPRAIRFDARLMQRPQPGEFSLVYDALNLWPSDQPLPTINHSAFIQSDDGRVIGAYVTQQAASQLQSLADQADSLPLNCHLYAVHIYNYANGPRLIVIAAGTSSQP
ncbi:hypothetical protein [Motiliproteus sp.]|uniref:hypothetical protein n=1 Tax=Motiliproteus sp. TaxID=1898955 RepID=UPI003BAA1CBB